MTCFLKNGNTFMPASEEALNLHKELPPGNYIIKQDQFQRFFLEKIDSFELPSKLYGLTEKHTNRIISTFNNRTASTGVLLAGEKGSGKTLLAKSLSVRCAERGMPTIVINSEWVGDGFNKLMQDINQPCVILFDEFEKVYSKENQTHILTLLDGVFPSKKLFVLTCNDKYRIDEHMQNRPGRIFYMLEFKGLEVSFIEDYCKDNLLNKRYVKDVCKISGIFSEFNFDMLKALVEEMNRYDETPKDALEMLNIKPSRDHGQYEITVSKGGVDLNCDKDFEGSPLSYASGFTLYVCVNADSIRDYDDEDCAESIEPAHAPSNKWVHVEFDLNDLVKVDQDGKIVYKNKNGFVAIFKKKSFANFNFNHAAF